MQSSIRLDLSVTPCSMCQNRDASSGDVAHSFLELLDQEARAGIHLIEEGSQIAADGGPAPLRDGRREGVVIERRVGVVARRLLARGRLGVV
jgi:hypothetical protein